MNANIREALTLLDTIDVEQEFIDRKKLSGITDKFINQLAMDYFKDNYVTHNKIEILDDKKEIEGRKAILISFNNQKVLVLIVGKYNEENRVINTVKENEAWLLLRHMEVSTAEKAIPAVFAISFKSSANHMFDNNELIMANDGTTLLLVEKPLIYMPYIFES